MRLLSASLCVLCSGIPAFGQGQLRGTQPVPQQRPFLRRETASRALYTKILEAEDQRVYKTALADMLNAPHVGVRRRAAAAIGRIGDPAGVAPLLALLSSTSDDDAIVRADAAFALGEIESAQAFTRLVEVLSDPKTPSDVRARSVEAVGKIAANERAAKALGDARLGQAATAIAAVLPAPSRDLTDDDVLLGSLGVVALLRIKRPESTAPVVAQLASKSVVLRWQTANALARLRPDPASAPDAVARLTPMLRATNGVERANAARALGALKAKPAVDALVALLEDPDERVRVSAVRALGAIGEARAAAPLNALGEKQLAAYAKYASSGAPGMPPEQNLLIVVAEAFGALKDPSSLALLQRIRAVDGRAGSNPETEIAVAAYGEAAFFDIPASAAVPGEWHHVANYAQGLGALGGERAKKELVEILAGRRFGAVDAKALSDVLTALGKVKPEGFEKLLVDALLSPDFVVRTTAAQLVGEQFAPSQSETAFTALEAALKTSASDADPDARLAILDAIAKYKRQRTLDLLAGALKDPNYLVRRRAAELLEAADAGSFVSKLEPVKTPPRRPGYYDRIEQSMRRANPVAVIKTDKGEVRIELLVRDAPMTVDNFVELARKKYFDGVVIHRVVPNFVMQDGDPRGDGNGSPGYQIRCEINEVPYDRGAVGMALSGKDTGGSQFFITHAPQPHLDGGYTVFARVTDGMQVVDRLARGDRIVSVTIVESDSRQ